MGIHQGDIIRDGDDMFGDGVNVAARLEGLAEPGGICVSGRVQEDARGKLDVAFEDTGEQQLKNIEHSVRVYRIDRPRGFQLSPCLAAAGQAVRRRASISEYERRSRAGIFRGWRRRRDHHCGVAFQELIRDRAKFDVPLQGSGSGTVKQNGRELGVRYVLEGSVRSRGTACASRGSLSMRQPAPISGPITLTGLFRMYLNFKTR